MTLTNYTSPSGMTFALRAPEAVPERLRRPVARKLVQLASVLDSGSDGTSPQVGAEDAPSAVERDLTDADLELADELNDLLAVALIAEWSIAAPVSVDALLDLGKGDYDAVRRAVAPFVTSMLPDFAPSPDPESPTQP